MKLEHVKNNFSIGLLDDSLADRSDLDIYKHGCSELTNFNTNIHGGIEKRKGTEYILRTNSNIDAFHYFVPFQFNSTESFVIALYPQYIILMQDGKVFSERTGGSVRSDIYPSGSSYDLTGLDAIPLSTFGIDRGANRSKRLTGYTQSLDLLIMFFEDSEPYVLFRKYEASLSRNKFFFVPYFSFDARIHKTFRPIKPTEWTGTNWPRNGVYYQNRLWMTSTPDRPQTIWATQTGNFFNFLPRDENDIEDDDALEFTISDDNYNEIKWIASNKDLIMGTENGEFVMSATDSGDPITPSDISIVRYSSYGNKLIKPIVLDDSLFFVQLGGKSLRQFQYDYTRRHYISIEISLYIKNLIGEIKDIKLSTTPNNIIYCLMTDGSLYSCLIEYTEKTLAWSKINVNGKVTHIQTIREGNYHNLYMNVIRFVNGIQYEYIERISSDKEIFLDSHVLRKSSSNFTDISGLAHLKNREVLCIHGGGIESHTVSATGTLTLKQETKKVYIGFPFRSIFKSMNVQIEQEEYNSKTFYKRISFVLIHILKSLSVSIGTSEDNLETVVFRNQDFRLDSDLELFSGVRKISVDDDSDYISKLVIVSEDPVRCQILSLSIFIGLNGL